MTRNVAFVLGLSVPCLLLAACALGTSDPSTVNGTDGGAGGDSAGVRDAAASSDTGFPSPGIDASDAPTSDSSSTDSAEPSDAGSDTAVSDASEDAQPPLDASSDTGSVCGAHGFSGTLVTFDLSSQPGDETTATATSTATDVTSTALARASAISAVSGSGSINGSNWGTGSSADPTRYYTFTVTPSSGCTLHVTSLTYDVKASSSGPSKGDVATSVDTFGTHSTAFAGTSTGTATLSATSSGAIEVRIYGFGASSSGGTFRIENTMTLGGSLQ